MLSIIFILLVSLVIYLGAGVVQLIDPTLPWYPGLSMVDQFVLFCSIILGVTAASTILFFAFIFKSQGGNSTHNG